MSDALQKRTALLRVPMSQRKAWAALSTDPCGSCESIACPYPSHWSGTRLDAAFAALVTTDTATEETETTDNGDGTYTTAPVTNGADALADALRAALAHAAPDVDQVKAIAREEVRDYVDNVKAKIVAEVAAAIPRATRIEVVVNDRPAVDVGLSHKQFPALLKRVTSQTADCQMNVWLAGPAGSGKTTAAKQVAAALGLPFYFNGAIDTEYKLSGFVDAHGRIVSTPFRKAFIEGGVYLFDECDASMPAALLAFNAALSNGHCDFPGLEEPAKRHADCHCLAAANTWGLGATDDYVGRMKLDKAFLDRFSRMGWDYDEELERRCAGNDKWTDYVQRVRHAARARGLKIILSPRASMRGAAMLAQGHSWDECVNAEVACLMSEEDFRNVSR